MNDLHVTKQNKKKKKKHENETNTIFVSMGLWGNYFKNVHTNLSLTNR